MRSNRPGRPSARRNAGQLYEALISALEQMDQVLGAASLETELFVQLFSMLLQNTSVGSIPSVCDAVQLTTLPMLRHRRTRVLLVLGANDGLLPAFSDPGGCLPTRSGRSSAVSAWNSVRGAARPLTAK